MLNAWRDCSETLTRKQQSEMKAYFFCINNWDAFHVITWYIWAIVLFLIYVQYRKNLMSSRTCQVPSVPQQNLLDLVCFELENSNSPECTQFKYALFFPRQSFLHLGIELLGCTSQPNRVRARHLRGVNEDGWPGSSYQKRSPCRSRCICRPMMHEKVGPRREPDSGRSDTPALHRSMSSTELEEGAEQKIKRSIQKPTQWRQKYNV